MKCTKHLKFLFHLPSCSCYSMMKHCTCEMSHFRCLLTVCWCFWLLSMWNTSVNEIVNMIKVNLPMFNFAYDCLECNIVSTEFSARDFLKVRISNHTYGPHRLPEIHSVTINKPRQGYDYICIYISS